MPEQHLILGFRISGQPIFGFRGAEGDGDAGGGDGGTGSGNQPDPNALDDNGLTQRGRDAITAERNTTKAARNELRPWKAVGAEFGFTTPDQIREALQKASSPGTQQQPPVDEAKIRQEAEAAATAKANRRVARAEVKALAAVTFADPEDAVSVMSDEDLDDLLDRNGALSPEAAKHALADTLAKKPHWAKVQKEQPPNFDGGSRNTSGGGQQDFATFVRGQVAAKRGH